MCITEDDEELTLALEREEGREEGIEIGIERGIERGTLLTLADLVQDGIITLAQAAKKAKMTKKEFEAKLKALQSEPQLT